METCLYTSSTEVTDFTTQEVDDAIAELMKQHDPILLFASRLLPADTAADASALYAWCRRLDEIVDDPVASLHLKQTKLEDWQEHFEKLWHGNPTDAMDAALTQTLGRHPDLNKKPFEDMIAGMQSDAVEHRRVANMAELELYAYQVAGTVGLMLLPLLLPNDATTLNNDGNCQRRTQEAALALGTAIQLINILRDARPDAALGRIYLPQDLLRTHKVEEQDILNLHPTPAYRHVVETVANRVRQCLFLAESSRDTLPGLGPLFVQLVVEFYRGYLEELKERNYDNLSRGGRSDRVKINAGRKAVASWTALTKVIFQLQ